MAQRMWKRMKMNRRKKKGRCFTRRETSIEDEAVKWTKANLEGRIAPPSKSIKNPPGGEEEERVNDGNLGGKIAPAGMDDACPIFTDKYDDGLWKNQNGLKISSTQKRIMALSEAKKNGNGGHPICSPSKMFAEGANGDDPLQHYDTPWEFKNKALAAAMQVQAPTKVKGKGSEEATKNGSMAKMPNRPGAENNDDEGNKGKEPNSAKNDAIPLAGIGRKRLSLPGGQRQKKETTIKGDQNGGALQNNEKKESTKNVGMMPICMSSSTIWTPMNSFGPSNDGDGDQTKNEQKGQQKISSNNGNTAKKSNPLDYPISPPSIGLWRPPNNGGIAQNGNKPSSSMAMPFQRRNIGGIVAELPPPPLPAHQNGQSTILHSRTRSSPSGSSSANSTASSAGSIQPKCSTKSTNSSSTNGDKFVQGKEQQRPRQKGGGQQQPPRALRSYPLVSISPNGGPSTKELLAFCQNGRLDEEEEDELLDECHQLPQLVHEQMERAKAELLLGSLPFGTHLLRRRPDQSLALSLKAKDAVLHIKLELRHGHWILGEGPRFRSVHSMLRAYRRSVLPVRGAEQIRLGGLVRPGDIHGRGLLLL